MTRLLLLAAGLATAGCGGSAGPRVETPPPADIVPGGVYSGDLKDGTFTVFKVVKIDGPRVAIKGYGRPLKARPDAVPADFDQKATVGLAIGGQFAAWGPQKLADQPVTAAEESAAAKVLSGGR